MKPSRGDIWLVDLNPFKGHEQAGKRSAVVISVDLFNHGPSGLVVILPVTSKWKGIPFHVAINPEESGLKEESYIKCEDVRSVSCERLSYRLGSISSEKIELIEDRVKILLGL